MQLQAQAYPRLMFDGERILSAGSSPVNVTSTTGLIICVIVPLCNGGLVSTLVIDMV